MGAETVFLIVETVYVGILGLLIGSFLNVCIYRIPEGRTVVKGHSMCMSCSHKLSALDLVPLFSWLFLRGKCRYCGAPIASRYAKIEGLTAAVFMIIAYFRKEWLPLPGFGIGDVPNLIKLVLLLVLAAILITEMMIRKDHGIGRPGIFVVILSILAVRLLLLVFEPARALDTLVSSAMAAAACIAALTVAVWFSPDKQCSRLFWDCVFHFEGFREYFAPEQRALRMSDGIHAAVCMTLGFYPAMAGVVVYTVIRIFVPWEKSIRYLGIVTAASALLGILLPVFGVFSD